MGKDINTFGLVPQFLKFNVSENKGARETISETNISVSEADPIFIHQFNSGQKAAFNTMINDAYAKKKGCFFIVGK